MITIMIWRHIFCRLGTGIPTTCHSHIMVTQVVTLSVNFEEDLRTLLAWMKT